MQRGAKMQVDLTPEECRALRVASLMRIDALNNEIRWARPTQLELESKVADSTSMTVARYGLEIRDIKAALEKLEGKPVFPTAR